MKKFSELLHNIIESKQKEKLTQESLSKLTYLKKHLTNEQVKEIFDNYIYDNEDYYNNFLINIDDLTTMLKNKGLTLFGPIKDTSKYILKLFTKNNHESILKKIINDYFAKKSLSIDDLETTGNIFNDFCKGWENEAKELASLTYKATANVGPYEVLLKFLLQEAGSGQSGDIEISSNKEFEVKCMTWNKSGKSGGHLAGQKAYGDSKIRKSWSIYMYLNENLFHLEKYNNKLADKAAYFQNNTGFKNFIKLCEVNKLSNSDIAKGLVNSLCFQYNYITNDRDKDGNMSNIPSLSSTIIEELYKQTEEKLKTISELSFQDMKNIIGCIQFNLYSFIENFDYIFIGFLSDQINKQEQNGKYFFYKKDSTKDIVNFNVITDNLYFGPLETTDQGRTGKIYLKF